MTNIEIWKTEMERMVLQFIKKHVGKDTLNDVNELKDILLHACNEGWEKYIKERYYIIRFDSPMGYRSEKMLQDVALDCRWFGDLGNRGMTIVYLPKDKWEINSPEQFRDFINTMVKMGNGWEKLEALLDKDSGIALE